MIHPLYLWVINNTRRILEDAQISNPAKQIQNPI
jgi:hypothetical protein